MRVVGVAWDHAWPLTILKPVAEIQVQGDGRFVICNG
jgi:hypothetical protein